LIKHFYPGLMALVMLQASCAGIRSNPQYTESKTSTNHHKGKSGAVRYAGANSLTERRLFRQIEAYLGVRYRWGGTSASGMDCSGFVRVVYKNAANLVLPHSSRKMYGRGQHISVSNLQFGDLVFFENIESKGVSHVGIYVGDEKFAHASTSRGVVISSLGEKYYRVRYAGARRVHNQ